MQIEKTPEEKIQELQKEIGNVWFHMGRNRYEIEILEKSNAQLSIRAHNLNHEALEIHKKLKKDGAEVKLAAPLTDAPKLEGLNGLEN
jgi:hypothetical protein